MKSGILLVMLFISTFGFAQTENLSGEKIANIKTLISLFKQNKIESISNKIEFPFRREYPIPSIKTKEEFKKRFNEVFDKILIDRIVNSKMSQWNQVGWRGIMLDNGTIWIDSNEGNIIAVNYQSNFEKQLKKVLIEKEKKHIHSSLKNFEKPIYKINCKNYLIRIDQLGNQNFRYAAWEKGKDESTTPDLILNYGKREFEGSGGNHVFTFTSGKYTYRVYRNIIGEDDSPDITHEVENNGKIILTEGGMLVGD